MAIVFGLIPHDRDDLQAITDPGELVVVHDVPEGEEQWQREGRTGDALAARQLGEIAPGVAQQQADGGNGSNKPDHDADGGPGAVLDQDRHQFENLATKEEIGRVERVGEEDLLLLADDGRYDRQRCDQHGGLVFAAENAIDGEQDQEKCADGGPGRAPRIEEVADRVGHGLAHDQLDCKNEGSRDRQREQCTACGGQRLGVPRGKSGSIGVDPRSPRYG
ncbi:hypothetical protein D3C87_1498590 [compost metagenome]